MGESGSLATQLRKGVAPYCALALIASGPRYGYALARAMSDAGIVAGSGSVYPLLARLQADGLVTARWQAPEAVGRGIPRKYYALTTPGQAALEEFRRQWAQLLAGVDALLGAPVVGGGPGGSG